VFGRLPGRSDGTGVLQRILHGRPPRASARRG
jgi:hypothetical protein